MRSGVKEPLRARQDGETVFRLMVDVLTKVNITSKHFNRLEETKRVSR